MGDELTDSLPPPPRPPLPRPSCPKPFLADDELIKPKYLLEGLRKKMTQKRVGEKKDLNAGAEYIELHF